MGRYKDYRERERPGSRYESNRDDQPPLVQLASPSRVAPQAVTPVVAIVKWFNAERGFGFVSLAEGSTAFLHVRQVERAGHSSLPEGARVRVRIGPGQKGPEVTEVIDVDLGTLATSPTPPRVVPASRVLGETKESVGTVKSYKAEQGYGFVGQDDGGKDVFVHATALARAGLTRLTEGQRVRMRIGQGRKGLEAQSIEPLD